MNRTGQDRPKGFVPRVRPNSVVEGTGGSKPAGSTAGALDNRIGEDGGISTRRTLSVRDDDAPEYDDANSRVGITYL